MRSIGVVLENANLVRPFLEMLAPHQAEPLQPPTRKVLSVPIGERRILVPEVRGYGPGLARDIEAMRLEQDLTDVLRLGTCGGYASGQQVGDVILATAAVRGEGTSFCYLDDARFPAVADFELTRLMDDRLRESGLRYRTGTMWSTDGRVAGQYEPEKIRLMQSSGVIGVEMQTATLFVLGKVMGFRAASMAIVVDMPSVHGAFDPLPTHAELEGSLLRILLDLALTC